jgi:hypothetical protein
MLRHCWYNAFQSDWLHPSAFHPSGTFPGRLLAAILATAGVADSDCAPTLVSTSAARSPTTITIAVVFIFSPFAYRAAGRSLERALYYAVHDFHFTELVLEQQWL